LSSVFNQPERAFRLIWTAVGLDVILEEGSPGLRGLFPAAHQVLAYARFSGFDTDLQKFVMDPRRAPETVFTAHFAEPEAFAAPSDNDLRLNADEGGTPAAPDLALPGPEESIDGGQPRPLHGAMQDPELVPEGERLLTPALADGIPQLCRLPHARPFQAPGLSAL